MKIVHGAESFEIRTGEVELCCTRAGGMMAPVRFNLGGRWVQPYSLPPWQPQDVAADTPPILKTVRGDFFGLPFGDHPVHGTHGDSPNLPWELVEGGDGRLVLDLKMKTLPGAIRKTLRLRPGHRAVYQEHRVSGLDGCYNYGYHATLQFPDDEGTYWVNTSPFKFGSTFPGRFSDPAIGESGALKGNARFSSLAEVPLEAGGTTSLQQYPARDGNEDLVMVSSRDEEFAWTAVTLDGFIWLSLKNPRVLPSTLFWISNGGRPQPPWGGRHRRRLGLEEVNGYFCLGLEASRQDLLKAEGISTTGEFKARRHTDIRSVHVVHPVAATFGMVTEVLRVKEGLVRVVGAAGATAEVPVDWGFLYA